MNVTIPLNQDNPLSFWIVVVAIAVLATAVLVFARARRWTEGRQVPRVASGSSSRTCWSHLCAPTHGHCYRPRRESEQVPPSPPRASASLYRRL